MKKTLILLLILSMTFCFAACGGSGNAEEEAGADIEEDAEAVIEEAAEEAANNAEGDAAAAIDAIQDETGILFSGGDFDFGLDLLQDFSLMPAFEKREYKDLLESEDEFRAILKEGLSDGSLGTFRYNDSLSLKSELEYAINAAEEAGQPLPEEVIEEYRNMVFTTGSAETENEFANGGTVQIGIIKAPDEIEDGDAEETEVLFQGKFQHYAEYTGGDHDDIEGIDYEALSDGLKKTMGIVTDPEKLKAGFAEAFSEAALSDEMPSGVILSQEIVKKGDGWTEKAVISVSAFLLEDSNNFRLEMASRTRVYD